MKRIEKTVSLKMPEKLQSGCYYQLSIQSNSGTLQGRVIKLKMENQLNTYFNVANAAQTLVGKEEKTA